MKVLPQILVIVALTAVVVPVSAAFIPATRPWLDQIGLLQPLEALGVVPEQTEETSQQAQSGNRGSGPANVIADPVKREVLRDVIAAIGSGRGVQSVDLSFGVTGRITALKVAAGDRVAEGDVIAELDDEAAALLVARAELVLEDAQKTIARLDQLSQSGTTTNLQRQDAELALRTAELALQSSRRDLADHLLRSPIDGYVGLIEPQVGDLVSPTTSITRIEDRSSLIVDFRVPERLAAQVVVGGTIRATAISAPGKVLEGQIVAIDNRVDETSRTLRVQASIANAEDSLRAGMAFEITLEFTGAEFPSVDPLAIQWGSEGAFVWVVREDKAARVPIRILQRNADSVLIEGAFEESDLVVTEGVQALRPGADVSVVQPRS